MDVYPHIYYAIPDRESRQQQERQSFLHRVYSGSAGNLIAAFLKEDREKLRSLRDNMEVWSMFDIWAFLLQTLTASGVAILLLVVKAMFRDNPKDNQGIL